MFNLKEMLEFPLKDKEWLMKIILGAVITIVPVLNLLSMGYLLKCIHQGARGIQELPEWDEWVDLFKDGVLVFVILILYLLVPLVLGFILSLIPGVGQILYVVLVFAAGAVIPMAIANFSVRRELADAFAIGEIIFYVNRVLNYYAASYFAYFMILLISTGLFIGIPFIGSFMASIIIFYASIVFFTFLGIIYREATAR